MDTIAIEQIADQMMELHSFSYGSWIDAKKIARAGKYYHCFDALSLCEYDSNLSVKEKNLLSSILSNQFSEKYDRRHQQTRNEYESLFRFLVTMNSPYRDYKITKETRPDFILDGRIQIGLEVVEFITEPIGILYNISRQNFGLGKTPEEIRASAASKHGRKADWYRYSEINGRTTITTRKMSDLNRDRDDFALKILQKWEKYREIAPLYDKFMLLCDARNTIAVTDEYDTHSIISCLQELDSSINHFIISIMYDGNDNKIHVGSYDL